MQFTFMITIVQEFLACYSTNCTVLALDMLMTLVSAGHMYDEFSAEVGLSALSSLTQLTSLAVRNISNLSNFLLKTWARELQMLKSLCLVCRDCQGLISDFPGMYTSQDCLPVMVCQENTAIVHISCMFVEVCFHSVCYRVGAACARHWASHTPRS